LSFQQVSVQFKSFVTVRKKPTLFWNTQGMKS